MTARRGYVVATLRSVEVGPEIRQYMETIESTFEPFGGEWVVHGVRPHVLEGPWDEDVVIVGFPSRDAAQDWYDSTAYQELLDLRAAHSDSRVVLLDGVSESYRAADTVARLMGA